MELRDSTVLILGGAGLVGLAVARRVIPQGPKRVIIASLFEAEAHTALEELSTVPGASDVSIEPHWGDLFVPADFSEWGRRKLFADADARRLYVDDLYGPLTQEVFDRSALGRLIADSAPDIIVDCINTAGALAYQDPFAAAAQVREEAANGGAGTEAVERLLSTLYLPQLIRHAQITLAGMKQARTRMYVKVGTAGTGGMGLNIPFTHSEERPSRTLLAKSSLAGAHTLLLYLMARTPDAPAVKEVKPTAAISWKSIGRGPVTKGQRPLMKSDATGAVPWSEAFGDQADGSFSQSDEELHGVFLDAGENGLFSLPEFEALTALGLMEFVTPEEIAENVFKEITAHPTGKDVVAALDGATMGPTYRAGVLRSEAIRAMEALENEQGYPSVAYEMLGPPRLSKILFEAEILRRLLGTLEAASDLDAEDVATRAEALLSDDDELRRRIVSIGIPILKPDGANVLRGAVVKVPPESLDGGLDESIVAKGWVDLRATNWVRWRERAATIRAEIASRPTVLEGSIADRDYGDDTGELRPGQLASWIFRTEDEGLRIKR